MARLPFDPLRARGAAKPASPTASEESGAPSSDGASKRKRVEPEALSVSQVVDLLNEAYLEHLPPKLRVVGEISNLSFKRHCYFSLKDDGAVLRCVAWASACKNFKFRPDNGLSVVATGSIEYYGPQGQTQLYVAKLEPVGAGVLELRFRALCEELRGLGYFDPARKRALPVFPRKIAVITSAAGAALHDVLDTLRRRCPAVGVVLVDVWVQGPQAAPDIATALKTLAGVHRALGIDAVLLARGGGSIEDLWAFNERVVADALLDFPIPTVAAIGHETDTTIAELVADCRCATPTQAAMRLAPDGAELIARLRHWNQRFRSLVEHRLRHARQGLRHAAGRLGRPQALIAPPAERLDCDAKLLRQALNQRVQAADLSLQRAAGRLEQLRPARLLARRLSDLRDFDRCLDATIRERCRRALSRIGGHTVALEGAHARLLVAATARLDRAESVLRGLDPRSVLQRGYSITRRATDGRIVRRVEDASAGDRLFTHVSDGVLQSEVSGREHRSESGLPRANGASPKPARHPGRGARSLPPGQMDLFAPRS